MVIYRAYSLNEPCSNNVTEYNALLISLQVAKQLDIEFLEAYGDSQLIVNQVRGTYEVRNPDLIPYHQVVIELVLSFKGFFIEFVPRSQNLEADALASLAADLAVPIRRQNTIILLDRDLFCVKNNLYIEQSYITESSSQQRDWRSPFIDYAVHGILPEDPKEAASSKRRSFQFYYDLSLHILYRRSYDGILLYCLSESEAKQTLHEAHDGVCGAHQPGPKL
ncbi:uncharacterized protein M6B38_316615 [Iris pallida]|uniref:RNase H type-1 domain-containing protein n=1 Tax=Iris pallida TaxID=29817 RepID=A0AAX6HEE4_IRIPA|nr:uncharacterized protein M6B38_316615 [Iris pallida]